MKRTGLPGGEISDFVRIVTAADIFGAVLDKRSYKPPLAPEIAFQQLINWATN